MQTLSGNQRPDLLISLMNMSFVLRLPRKMHLSRSSSNAPRLPSFLDMPQNPHVFLTFDKVHTIPCAGHAKQHLNVQKWSKHVTACAFSTSQLQKVLRAWCALCILTWKCASATMACTFSKSQLPKVPREGCSLCILTWKCASRHNSVHFFDISTSKSGPELRCFANFILTSKCTSRHNGVHFFDISTSKTGAEVLCTSWLGNLLRATTACNFSSLLSPDGSAPTYFSTLRSHKSLENTVFRDFATFSRTCIFCLLTWLFLFSDIFSFLLFSDSSHLCFFICPYCRKFDF